MKVTSRFARVVGVASLAAILVTGLAACGTPAGMNEDYLVLANVNGVDCSTVENPGTVADEMQATADFVSTASTKQQNDILALNEGLESLEPLTAALNTQALNCGGNTDAGPTNDESVTLSPELMALLDAANAPLEEYSCVKIVGDTGGTVIEGTYTLFVNTLLEVDEGDLSLRQWSDALSTVLKGSTPEEMRNWLNRAICEEPVIGVSLAHLFAHLQVGNTTVLSLQTTDWLQPFAVDASEINDLVAQYTPLTVWRLENFGKQDIPEDVYVAALSANHEYQELASRLVFLLSRYQLAQVMSINSTHHYHLVAGGLTADGIPEVEISHEVDSRPSLVFYLTEKTACKPISVLAFNTGDKRPMLGSLVETCEELTTPPAPPSSECTENCGSTPPPPGCTENCNPTPPCTTDCAKDPADDVTPPPGVTPEGPGEEKPRPTQPENPAPVIPEDEDPAPDAPAPGVETPPNPTRPTPPPATGDDGGSVNPGDGGSNQGDPGNPFG